MHPAVHVPLHGQEPAHVVGAEAGPVVAGEHHVGVIGPQVDGLLDVLAPGQGVAGLRSPDRVEVVQGVGAVLGHAQHPAIREVEVHLRGRLGVGGVLEDDPDAAEGHLLARLGNGVGGRDQRPRRQAQRRAQTAVDVPERAGRQEGAELVRSPPHHDVARDHDLAHDLLEESDRRHDAHVAPIDRVPVGHAENAAEMVDVGVGVDHRGHRPLAQGAVGEVERGRRAGPVGQRVDHHPAAVVPGEERDVGDVVAAHLPDAVGDLEQAVVDVQAGLPPESRVHRVRRGLGLADELTAGYVVDDVVTEGDPAVVKLRNPPPGSTVVVARIVE